ncbi:site-specific tyrosine recombinase XerD [Symmachiella dynata]|uniref:Site-specific tyrosine recombinase XerD n=1 Tax=Symmachiella dynata TaxID=2527995 RepID=A0A517ZVT4_9PLAN|nr:site-specific integrase [Symmachiella dynata]QDU46592.1 site-specific tyrosine recombinase XerD [Symmachiella dynata]
MSAWVKQKKWQVEKHGEKKASWYAEWNEPDGTRRAKSCGTGSRGKRAAERLAARIREELITGTYQREERKTWDEFRQRYEADIKSRLRPASVRSAKEALSHLERIIKPKQASSVTAERISEFVRVRKTERGKKKKSKVSPATVNGNLRCIKAALRLAHEWGYIKTVPRFRMEKEPKKLPNYVTPEHFALMYQSAGAATKPAEAPYPIADWWRALLITAQMTGWRIGELLSLRWDDVDLDAGTAITRHSDNKGGRDEKVALHPIVIEHIRPLRAFVPCVFQWDHDRRTLDVEFAKIQDAAGIKLPCRDSGDPRHGKCTDACYRYGFHDERRAFATLNAENMTREALQVLMRHKSANTTDRYINMARQIKPAVANLHVPALSQQQLNDRSKMAN